MPSIERIVAAHLADARAGWAIGTFGAIAEFQRAADEPVELSAHSAVTARGGIRLHALAAARIVAWERPTSAERWTQGVALCLPLELGTLNARTAVTELGPDGQALREADRKEILFDLGIGAPHCDFCVRTSDPVLLQALRAAAAQTAAKPALFAALAAASPTRVIVSRAGRIEVRTPIPPPGGVTPDGPHTHVLPELLRHKRTHSANVPLPAGVVPVAELFPPQESFDALFVDYGDPACLHAKRETAAAVRAGAPPYDAPGYSRAQRQARRVALRQLARNDGPSPALAAWRQAFDSPRSTHDGDPD